MHTDVLNQFQKGSLSNEPYDLVANLPYYIATTIILNALEDPYCRSMTVMVQKEVAEKFAAVPKTKEFSSLTILAQSIATATLLFDVAPTSFEPQPKVTSSILRIDKKQEFIQDKFLGIFENSKKALEIESDLKDKEQKYNETRVKLAKALKDGIS